MCNIKFIFCWTVKISFKNFLCVTYLNVNVDYSSICIVCVIFKEMTV